MMKEEVLEQFYRERLEEKIISCFAERTGLPLDKAMDVFYTSELSRDIYHGREGVQYLDYKVLAQILYDMEIEDGVAAYTLRRAPASLASEA